MIKGIVIDFEASGLSPESYPIEFAAYDLETEKTLTSFLIKPAENWKHWDNYAEVSIHHISKETLNEKGISVDKACGELINLFESSDKPIISDAPKYDQFWMDVLFEGNGEDNPYLVKGVEQILNSLEDHLIFEQEFSMVSKPHRAAQDAQLLGEILKRVVGEYD